MSWDIQSNLYEVIYLALYCLFNVTLSSEDRTFLFIIITILFYFGLFGPFWVCGGEGFNINF